MNRLLFMTSLVAAASVPACRGKPELPLQIQGTVTAVGYGSPVPRATVLVEWPATLGGGASELTTDRQGRYAVNRTVRADSLVCTGLTITVRAPGYASAYSSRDSTQSRCGSSLLTVDFKVFPLQ